MNTGTTAEAVSRPAALLSLLAHFVAFSLVFGVVGLATGDDASMAGAFLSVPVFLALLAWGTRFILVLPLTLLIVACVTKWRSGRMLSLTHALMFATLSLVAWGIMVFRNSG